MINLQPFCSTDASRPGLLQPFSLGGYTYATNGQILVRVPRREDVPERVAAPNPTRHFADVSHVSWRPLRTVNIPAAIKKPCPSCDGRGTEHDCPNCECECDDCGGSGTVVGLASISIGAGPFNAEYVRLLASLPGILVPETVEAGPNPPPMPFKFDGGDGVLMGLTGKYDTHIETPA
jgi:hypothetical protein